MLKIIKHEFIRGRAGILAMTVIAMLLIVMSLMGARTNTSWMEYLTLMLLIVFAFVSYIYSLVRGITAYSSELKDRTGYLLMMTPNSTYSIMFGKLIFSFLLAAAMLALSIVAIAAALINVFGSGLALRGYFYMFKAAMARFGINPNHVEGLLVMALISTLINIVMLVSLGYFTITVSATLFRKRRGHGFVTFLMFLAMLIALIGLEYLLSSAVMGGVCGMAELSARTAVRQVLPILGFNVCAICGLTCASAALLKRRVCL